MVLRAALAGVAIGFPSFHKKFGARWGRRAIVAIASMFQEMGILGLREGIRQGSIRFFLSSVSDFLSQGRIRKTIMLNS
jgi:hypothetical protein